MSEQMDLWEAVLLGLVEGLTEFLPISSTGHLTILEKLMGFKIDDPDVTAFTAIIQSGAVLATVLYLRERHRAHPRRAGRGRDRRARARRPRDFRFGIAVAVGCIPIAVVGLAFKDQIETTLRSLWFVGSALILWSGVMYYADSHATQERGEDDVRTKDTLIIGIVQCLALIPGVSRSGATMSAGLLRGLDRVTVTRLSFFLSIPRAGRGHGAPGGHRVRQHRRPAWAGAPTLLATAVSFVAAYVAISWLLRYIASHNYSVFIVYRVGLGVLVLALVASGAVAAT